MQINKYIFIFLLLVVANACMSDSIYERFENIKDEKWNSDDIKNFSFEITESDSFRVNIALRNTNDYKKANLWLFITTVSPKGLVKKDTLDCLLADDYGYWLGDGFSGLYSTSHFLFERRDSMLGKWTISIQQAMRADVVEGIEKVGVIVKPIKEK